MTLDTPKESAARRAFNKIKSDAGFTARSATVLAGGAISSKFMGDPMLGMAAMSELLRSEHQPMKTVKHLLNKKNLPKNT